jgi:hypothetical protein
MNTDILSVLFQGIAFHVQRMDNAAMEGFSVCLASGNMAGHVFLIKKSIAMHKNWYILLLLLSCFCAKRFIRGFPSFAQNAAKVWKEPKLAQVGT